MTFSHVSLNFGLGRESLSYLELHKIHCMEYKFTSTLPCIGCIQILNFPKYNSGIQQICYVIKAQPHIHKVTQRDNGRWGSPNVSSVCVCLLEIHLQSLQDGPGAMELQQPPLSCSWIWQDIFSSNKMQQKWQCSSDERENSIIFPKIISTLSSNGLLFFFFFLQIKR